MTTPVRHGGLVVGIVAVLLAAGRAGSDSPTSSPASAPSAQPATATPDLCAGAVDPLDESAERTRFFKAAGPDNELDAAEFRAAQGKTLRQAQGEPDGFVRAFDRWDALILFDKDHNGTIDWFEAVAYRRDIRARILAAFDTDKDGVLKDKERTAANESLARGVVPGQPNLTGRTPLVVGAGTATPAATPAAGTPAAGTPPVGSPLAGSKYPPLPASPYYQPDYMALMKKFHPAGDNKLTAEEWKELNKQVQAEREKWDLDRYDANHDGKLDAAEKKARNDSYAAYAAEVTRYYELITWDKNKDGHLDEQELAALNAYKEKMRVQIEEGKRRYEEMVRKFDVNGDGKLDENERKAMNEEYARQAEIKQYDTNGDGVLDEKEHAEMEADKAHWKKVAELQKQYYLKKYDLDGDGKVSGEEQKAMMEDYQRKFIARWDLDGDGKVSPAEMKAMSDTLTARYAKMRKAMDLNGDGEVTPAEARAYQKKQLEKYDTNKDGWIDPEEQERQNDDLDDYPDD